MLVGKLEWKSCAALAPMAGVADRAFREICSEFSAGYAVTEMVSAKGLCMGDRKSRELLSINKKERPCAAQLFGDDPEFMARAAVKALEFEPDAIDINMGCPAPKIAGNGGGSALMKDPELAERIVKAVADAVKLPVTVKMRIGWDTENINCVELAKRCENAGASALAVHGRTKVQMYAPPVYPDYIRAVNEAVGIDVVANGDVTDGLSAKKLMDESGCKAVMVGRGALGRPWVFEQIDAYLERGELIPEPCVEKRMEIMLRHIELLCKYKGERSGMLEARKHAAWYMKGIRGAAALRREICELSVIDDIKRIAQKVITTAE